MESLLRDFNREQGNMQKDIDSLQRHTGELRDYVQQYIRQTTIEWAKLVLDHPRAVLLVVETTPVVDENGYTKGGHEPIRFTALPLAGNEVWDMLVRPTHSRKVLGTEFHGLTMADVEDKPMFNEAWWPPIMDDHIIIFNAEWARAALSSVSQTDKLADAFCLHNKAKEYYGEFYDPSLERVLEYQGINKTRKELTDSRERIRVLAKVIRNLAAGLKKVEEPEPEPDEHPF